MKKFIVILGLALLGAGCGAATNNPTPANKPIPVVQNQPAKDGQSCSATQTCETGLKCINSVCSSGKVGSACSTYKDCSTGLFCIKSICSNPPSYTKYFSKITISKMKQGTPPGPDNIPVPATSFKTTDAVEIDLAVKPGVTGTMYYELIDSTTGLTAFSSADNRQPVRAGNWGTGFGIPYGLTGEFDLNVYYNDELVYTTSITINQ